MGHNPEHAGQNPVTFISQHYVMILTSILLQVEESMSVFLIVHQSYDLACNKRFVPI